MQCFNMKDTLEASIAKVDRDDVIEETVLILLKIWSTTPIVAEVQGTKLPA